MRPMFSLIFLKKKRHCLENFRVIGVERALTELDKLIFITFTCERKERNNRGNIKRFAL